MPRASLTLAPGGHWQGSHSTQRGHPLPGNPCLRGVWTWGHPGESRDLLGPSQLHRPPTCKQGVWWPAWPGNRPAAEGMVQRSLAGPVPVCPPVPGPAPAPPPPFLFHLAGSGAGAASLHAGGTGSCSGRGGSVRGGQGSGAGGAGGQPVSTEGRAGNYGCSQNQEYGKELSQEGGRGWEEEATEKIKKVFRGKKTKENGETGGKGERV